MLPAFPALASVGQTPQSARTRSAVSFPDEPPAQTSPTAPENLSETVRRPPGAEIRRRDRQRSGPQSCRLARFSLARPRPTGRIHSAGTRWLAAVKPLLLAVSPPSFPTTGRLPKRPPSAISGSAAAFGYRPLNA